MFAVGMLFDSTNEMLDLLGCETLMEAVYKYDMCVYPCDGGVLFGHYYIQLGDVVPLLYLVNAITSLTHRTPEHLRHRLHVVMDQK